MKTIRRISGICLMFSVFVAIAQAAQPKDFTVKSPINGASFTLSEHPGKVVVLHFLLKTECPFCLKHTHAYAKLAASTPNVIHLFLKPDSEEEIKAWSEKLSHEELKQLPTIYRDPDAHLAKEFEITDGYQFHGQVVHYPALVALDSSGKELFRYIGKKNSDRMKPADFTAKLQATKAALSQ